MKKQILTTIASIAMLLGGSIAYAQPLYDYGNGMHGTWNVSGTEYTDDVRAQVQSISGTTIVFDVNAANVHGFSSGPLTPVSGDRILIVQMEGGTVGTYEFATVNVTTYNPGTAVQLTINSTLTNTYSTGLGDVVQIIAVKEWYDVNLGTGDVITCHAYDGHTGGILCFFADGTLTVTNDGRISANGKGYHNIDGGGAGGAGGAANAGSVGAGSSTGNGNSASGGGGAKGNSGYSLCDGGGGSPLVPYRGGQGSGAGSAGTVGSPGDGATSHGDAVLRTYLRMGDAGACGNGGTGGQGGGNGGGGAAARNSSGPTGTGANGSAGQIGGTGGKGGDGGVGGGAIYIRCSNIDISGTSGGTVVSADGANGSAGQAGQLGGAGGNGGLGAAGNCTDPAVGGGSGGKGYGGDGASGGGGADGGEHGFIWVYYETSCDLTTSEMTLNGGIGGSGGAGATPQYGTTPAANIWDLSNGSCYVAGGAYHYCGTSVTIEVCDCVRAFKELADCNNAVSTGAAYDEVEETGSYPNKVRWYHTPGAGQEPYLAAYVYTSQPGSSTTPEIAYEHIYKCEINNDADTDGEDIIDEIVAAPAKADVTITGNDVLIEWDVEGAGNSNSHTFEYVHSTSDFELHDYSTVSDPVASYDINPECEAPCTTDCAESGAGGTSGDDADPGAGNIVQEKYQCLIGPDRKDELNDRDGNKQLNQSQIINSIEGDLVNDLGVVLYPNPATDKVNFTFTSNKAETMNIKIIDAAGKVVINTNVNVISGENTVNLNISELPAGNYMAKFIVSDKVSQIKFVVK